MKYVNLKIVFKKLRKRKNVTTLNRVVFNCSPKDIARRDSELKENESKENLMLLFKKIRDSKNCKIVTETQGVPVNRSNSKSNGVMFSPKHNQRRVA